MNDCTRQDQVFKDESTRDREQRQTTPQKPVIDPTLCNDCRECVAACPQHAIQEASNYACAKCVKYCISMEVPCRPANLAICHQLCDGCGACVDACVQGAIQLPRP